MEFREVIEKRRSVREFLPKEVDPEKLDRILQAANRAPSANNAQNYHIYVVRSKDRKDRIRAAAMGQEPVSAAPLLLVFCGDMDPGYGKHWGNGAGLYSIQNATIACAYAQLAAADEGLGSLWIGAFDAREVYKAMIPAGMRPAAPNDIPFAILAIGYPATEPEKTPRKELGALVRRL